MCGGEREAEGFDTDKSRHCKTHSTGSKCPNMYVRVCVCVCACIYIYVFIYLYIYMYIHIHTTPQCYTGFCHGTWGIGWLYETRRCHLRMLQPRWADGHCARQPVSGATVDWLATFGGRMGVGCGSSTLWSLDAITSVYTIHIYIYMYIHKCMYIHTHVYLMFNRFAAAAPEDLTKVQALPPCQACQERQTVTSRAYFTRPVYKTRIRLRWSGGRKGKLIHIHARLPCNKGPQQMQIVTGTLSHKHPPDRSPAKSPSVFAKHGPEPITP